jgi:hypothetical protein
LRKNKATNENPQEVSFVLKIEKNSSATGNALLSTPMRPQYMVVDIGKEWIKPSIASRTCKSGTVKVGYLLDGSPQCLSATKKCDSNKIQLGIDENGEPICASKPTTCLETESIVFDHSSKSLICSSSSPCSAGSFVGYYLGTGQSMCYESNPPCGEGKIQVGQSSVNGSPQCVSVTACTAEKPFLSFNGTSFSCLEAPTGLDGARGVAGDSGTPGIPGQPGPNGSSGPSGENGVDGNSAYSPKVFAYDQAPELYLFTKSMTTESNPKFRKWYTVDYDYPADAKYIVISAKCLEAISLWRYSDQTNIFPPPLPTLFYGDGSSKALRDHLVCWAANNAGDTATFRIEIPRASKKLQFLTDPVNDDVNLVDVRIVGFE